MAEDKRESEISELRKRLVDFSALRLQVAMDLDVRGKDVAETLANIERSLESRMPIEDAKNIVAEFHDILKKDKEELTDLIWKNDLGTGAKKWQIKTIIEESPEILSFHNEQDHAVIHLLSMLYFKIHGESHVANDKIFLSHMRYMTENAIERLRSSIGEADINKIVELSFYLGYSASLMYSSALYCSDVFQEAIHSSRSGKIVSMGKHEPEKEKYSGYVTEYALAAWKIGCELLHTQMAQLLVDGIDESLKCTRLKNIFAKVAPKDRVSGSPGVKKAIETCPCPKKYDCPIGRKLPRGETFELLAKCRPVED